MTGKLPPMALDDLAEQAINSPVAELAQAARRVLIWRDVIPWRPSSDTRMKQLRDELRDVATRCGIEIY